MRGPVIFAIVLALAWYTDYRMYGGQYFTAFIQMLSNVVHYAR
jgi:hypothetical protein